MVSDWNLTNNPKFSLMVDKPDNTWLPIVSIALVCPTDILLEVAAVVAITLTNAVVCPLVAFICDPAVLIIACWVFTSGSGSTNEPSSSYSRS